MGGHHPSDLESNTVYFHVSSHGYEAAADGFGFRGIRVTLVPGEQKVIRFAASTLRRDLPRHR